MTLQEMVNDIDGNNRFQLSQKEILRYMNAVQKAAFNHDCRAFIRESTVLLDDSGEFTFPEDTREIIKVEGLSNYYIDTLSRKIETRQQKPEEITVTYYRRPLDLTGMPSQDGETPSEHGKFMWFSNEDEEKVIVPDEWRKSVLMEPTIAMCDAACYGGELPQAALEQYFREWWQAMNARPNDREPVYSAGAW